MYATPQHLQMRDDFHREHGGEGRRAPVSPKGVTIFYCDGARMPMDYMGYPLLPPVNDYERFVLIEHYRKARLDAAALLFSNSKNDFVALSGMAVREGRTYDGEWAKEQLEKLKVEVRHWQAELKAVQDQIAETPEGKQLQQAKEEKAANSAKSQDAQNLLLGINI